MKIFYFRKNLGKFIPLCCLALMACWGIYGAYLGEPLSLRAGTAMDEQIEEGVSIALKIDDSGKISGEDVMKLAKELKAKRLTNVNMFFTKAWVQKYPEVVLVYKCGQEKLNNLYYQVKEQRRCSTWRRTKNLTLRNSSSRSWICTMPGEPRIHNWNVNMA